MLVNILTTSHLEKLFCGKYNFLIWRLSLKFTEYLTRPNKKCTDYLTLLNQSINIYASKILTMLKKIFRDDLRKIALTTRYFLRCNQLQKCSRILGVLRSF